MKKIVPFKKDIIFKTNLSEIISISLEHSLKIEEKTLSGSFIVSGEYKITDSSIDTEKFLYELPFNIVFDDKYNLDNSMVDINDFYYEIVNDSVLSINIEVIVDKIQEILIEDIKEDIEMDLLEDKELKNDIIKDEEIDIDIREDKRCIEEETEFENNIKEINDKRSNLFDNISIEETYNTYKIYIVRENDTIESIMEKYSITKENLELYNNLNEIKLGDKVIIPVIYEGN